MSTSNADETREALRRADPAATLAPVSADRLTRLAEDAMTDPRTSDRPIAPARRSPRPWILAGAGALVLGSAAVAIPLLVAAPAVTVLQSPPPVAAKCVEVTPDLLHAADLVFRADVTDIQDGTVTLHVTQRFQGDVTDTVQVAQGDDDMRDGGALVFTDGGSYLIAADDGTIGKCGGSGVATPELEAVYDAAFPG